MKVMQNLFREKFKQALIVCGILCTQAAFCDSILVKGKWSEEDFRSIIPAPPTVSIEGKVMTVNFVNPLADLTVKVTDNKTGKVVYELTGEFAIK